MTSITLRRTALIAATLATAGTVAQAAPVTVGFSATFQDQGGAVFGQPLPYAFSTSFTVDSSADPVHVVLGDAAAGADFYGYGREAVSGFAAVFGSHTFRDLVPLQLGTVADAVIYFDAPLASGRASSFFLRAADAAGTLSLGSYDCTAGPCTFGAFAMVDQVGGNFSNAQWGAASGGAAAPVPEPAPWALLLAGRGAGGAAPRRRRGG